MMPMLATISIGRPGRGPLVIWAPLFIVWIFATPLMILALPFINLALIATRMDPRSVAYLIRLVIALRGLVIDIQSPGARVSVRVY